MKRFIALTAVLFLILPLICFTASAEETEGYMFIHGENVTRPADSAIIYYGSDTVSLNSRGYDVVFDAEGIITEIHKGGIGDDRTISIPEGGFVVSAVGTANEWLKETAKVGAKMLYDRYTQKLFVCDDDGKYNPHFSESVSVTGENGEYVISKDESGASKYKYSVAVDENGMIISRGESVSAPEGGYTVSAVTVSDRNSLIMFAIPGGKCAVSEGLATFSYDSTMHKQTAELALNKARATVDTAKASFYNTDLSNAEMLLATAERAFNVDAFTEYYSVIGFLNSCENEISKACSPDKSLELRGAFHTPVETNEAEVKSIVASVKKAGLNTLILRVSNGYDTIIPLPESFPFKQDTHFGGFDVLQSYIDVCKQENIGLTLCIDVYYNKYAMIANRNWILENDNSIIGENEPEYETVFEGEYFSPASAEFKQYFLGYIDYIIGTYKIESLMFDYLRYPKFSELTDYGYDNETLTRFSESIGKPITECYKIRYELFESPLWKDWVKFKTSLIDDMAKSISDTVRAKRSDITLTAVAMTDTVDYYYMQNALGWIENGIMDGLCTAFYERDSKERDPLPEMAYYSNLISEKSDIFATYTTDDKYLFTGIDIGSGYSSDIIANAVINARKAGSDGFIFSDLKGYIAQSGLDFSDSIMKNSSLSPLDDRDSVIKTLLERAKARIKDLILPLGGCDETTAESAYAEIDAKIALLDEGEFNLASATELESNISMIFASSPAKNAVLEDFNALTKLMKLAKEEVENIIPPEENESSIPEESSTESEKSEDSEEESKNNIPVYSEDEDNSGIDIGNVLIFIFIGFALIASVAFIIILAIRNKSHKPVNRHMIKSETESDENESE